MEEWQRKRWKLRSGQRGRGGEAVTMLLDPCSSLFSPLTWKINTDNWVGRFIYTDTHTHTHIAYQHIFCQRTCHHFCFHVSIGTSVINSVAPQGISLNCLYLVFILHIFHTSLLPQLTVTTVFGFL